jgi:hypothetical protein
VAVLNGIFGLGRKKPEQANRELLRRLALERLAVFSEAQRRGVSTAERAWFAAGAVAAVAATERLGLGTLRESKALAVDELFTMPLISYWHYHHDERTGRDPAEGAEARAASFRSLQVAYGDLTYGVHTMHLDAQDRLNDAMALDWQFAQEMVAPPDRGAPSTYEGLVAEKMVAVLTGIAAPNCSTMGLPVDYIDELIERREDRAGFTAALEHSATVRSALTASFALMERIIAADAEAGAA